MASNTRPSSPLSHRSSNSGDVPRHIASTRPQSVPRSPESMTSQENSAVERPQTPLSVLSQDEDWDAFAEPRPSESASHTASVMESLEDKKQQEIAEKPSEKKVDLHSGKDSAFRRFAEVNTRLVARLEMEAQLWVLELERVEKLEKVGKGSEDVRRVESELRRAMSEYCEF